MATNARRRVRRKRERRAGGMPAAPELNEVSRAQLGRDPQARPHRPAPEDASMQDPLQDWPDEPES